MNIKCLKQELVKYHPEVIKLVGKFPSIMFEKVGFKGELIRKADALARVAKELSEPNGDDVHIVVRNRRCLASCFSTPEWGHQSELKEKDDLAEILVVKTEDDWRQHFLEYFKHGKLPQDKSTQEQLTQRRAPLFVFANDTLYRRSYDQMWLQCVSSSEAK